MDAERVIATEGFDPTHAEYWREQFELVLRDRNRDIADAHASAGTRQAALLEALRRNDALTKDLQRACIKVAQLKRALREARDEAFPAKTAKEARQLLRRAMRLIAHAERERRPEPAYELPRRRVGETLAVTPTTDPG